MCLFPRQLVIFAILALGGHIKIHLLFGFYLYQVSSYLQILNNLKTKDYH